MQSESIRVSVRQFTELGLVIFRVNLGVAPFSFFILIGLDGRGSQVATLRPERERARETADSRSLADTTSMA